MSFQRLLEFFYVDAVLLYDHADQLGIIRAEGIERTDETRVFTYDGIPLVAENLCRQIDALLSAGRHDQLVVRRADRELIAQTRLELLAQGTISLRHAVLQRAGRVGEQNLLGNGANFFNRKRRRRRVAGSK